MIDTPSRRTVLTPERCRQAREMAGLSISRLASESNLSVDTIKRFEDGNTTPRRDTLAVLLDAFENHGVVVRPEGVRWRLNRGNRGTPNERHTPHQQLGGSSTHPGRDHRPDPDALPGAGARVLRSAS